MARCFLSFLLLIGCVPAAFAVWQDPLPQQRQMLDGFKDDEAYLKALGSLVQAYQMRGDIPEALQLLDAIKQRFGRRPEWPQIQTAMQTTRRALQEMQAACGAQTNREIAATPLGVRLVPQVMPGNGFLHVGSADGRFLLSGQGEAVYLRSAVSGELLRRYQLPGAAQHLAVSPDSKRFAVITARGCLQVWNLSADQPSLSRRGAPSDEVLGRNPLAWSADGRHLGIAWPQAVEVWQGTAEGYRRSLFIENAFAGLQGGVERLLLKPDGSPLVLMIGLLLSWDVDGVMNLRGSTSDFLKSNGVDGLMLDLALLPGGRGYAFLTYDGLYQRNNDPNRKTAVRLVDTQGERSRMRLSPSGRYILLNGTKPGSVVFDLDEGREQQIPRSGRWLWVGEGRLIESQYIVDQHVYELPSDRVLTFRPPLSRYVKALAFSADGRELLVGGQGLARWNLDALAVMDPIYGGGVQALAQSDEQFAIAYQDEIRPVSLDNWQPPTFAGYAGLQRLPVGSFQRWPHGENQAVTALTDSAEYWISGGSDGAVKVWSRDTRELLHRVDLGDWPVQQLAVSADGRHLLAASNTLFENPGRGAVYRLDLARLPDAAAVEKLADDAWVNTLGWNAEGKPWWVHASGVGGEGRPPAGVIQYDGLFDNLNFTDRLWAGSEGQWWLARSWPKPELLRISADGQQVLWRKPLNAPAKALAHTDALAMLAVGLEDGRVVLWNLQNDAEIQLFGDSQSGWAAWTPDGYFTASRDAAGLIAAERDLKPYGIEQLSLRYNRPDILMERLGLASEEAVSYFRAWQAWRRDKAGIGDDGDNFSVPDVRLKVLAQTPQSLRLQVTIDSPEVDLRRWQLKVNGVAEVLQDDSLSGRQAQREVELPLSRGVNRIQVTATNRLGLRSAAARLQLQTEQGEEKPELYVLTVGVSKYADKTVGDLQYAAKDAADMAELWSRSEQYAKVHVKVLQDDQALSGSVRAAEDFLAQAAIDDTVILSLAGHGMHDRSERGEYYFLTHDSDPQRLAQTAVSDTDLMQLLGQSRARRRLMLVDSCESGEVGPQIPQELSDAGGGMIGRARGLGGFSVEGEQAPLEEAEAEETAARPWLLSRERFIFNDVGRDFGVTVFAAAGGREYSYEYPLGENGWFTHAFRQSLSTSSGLRLSFEELRKSVRDIVSQNTGGRQNPVVDRANLEADLWFFGISAGPLR